MKIHLQKLEKGLIFQILEQDLSIKPNFRKEIILSNGNRVDFRSELYPELGIRTPTNTYYSKRGGKIPKVNNEKISLIVNLRGRDTGRDFDIVTFMFKDNHNRDYIYDSLKYSFEKLSEELSKKKKKN